MFNRTQKLLIKFFVHRIDPTIKVKFSNFNFYCDLDSKTIFLPALYDVYDEAWKNFIYSEFSIDYDLYIISILHEIGHIFTTDEELFEDREVLYKLLDLGFQDDGNEYEYNQAYFHIPAELKATQWGANYYDEHRAICEYLKNQLERK